MAEVRRRRVATKPVTRPRDRVAATPVEEDEEEDVDVTRRPARTAKPAARTARPVAKRRAAPAPEPEEDLDEEEEDDDEEDEEEEEEAPRARRPAARTRRAAPVDDDDEDEDDVDDEDEDDDEEDEEPAPRRVKAKAKPAAAPKARRRAPVDDDEDDEDEAPATKRRSGSKLPPGIRSGMAGAEATAKVGGFGSDRLTIDKDPKLFKILESEPYASYAQHWIGSGQGNNRPYTCYGEDAGCPLCEAGNTPSSTFALNVLWLHAEGPPAVKTLQIGIKAWNDLKEKAYDKASDSIKFQKNYFAVRRTGEGQRAQTSFQMVKIRDIEEDWDELLDQFNIEDLPDIIAEAKKRKKKIDSVQFSSLKDLREVAKYLSED